MIMYAPYLLRDLHTTIRYIQKEMDGLDTGKARIARKAYRDLLEDFYEEYHDMMSRGQYEKAKDDADYFLAMIPLAYHYQTTVLGESEGEQAAPYFNLKDSRRYEEVI